MTIPYHLPNLTKPQKQYNFQVNNYSQFTHLLPVTCDGLRPLHPVEAFDPLDFALQLDTRVVVRPPSSLDSTPFLLVDDVQKLSYLSTKLSEVDEFAVDLEHNSYRSFQGITCLMQISTRSEDFVVDTLKLREYIGDSLRSVFMDPTKKKVIHGADNDIMWLQRDFNIYVVNMFDTMRGSQVLGHERNTLEYLLRYYCGVACNKEYQASDWRIRPIPTEMLHYAREDTHYLLFIYDSMVKKLSSKGAALELGFEFPLREVYNRSYDVCRKLYSIEVFDKETSYLYTYGLSESNLDGKQLGFVAALYEWRDIVSRKEDESCGYVLPNKLILEIAKRKPVDKQQLLELVGYTKEYVIRDADLIIDYLWKSRHANDPKFKEVARLLNKGVPPTQIAATINELRSGKIRAPPSQMQRMPNMHTGISSRQYTYGPVASTPAFTYTHQPCVYSYGVPYAYVNVPSVIHCL